MSPSFRMFGNSRAFLGTLSFFVLANVWSWLRHRLFPVCCDQEVTIGFPFPFHISGGLAGMEQFYVLGLLLDITLTLLLAVLATWIAVAIRKTK